MPSPPDRPVEITEQDYPHVPLPPMGVFCDSSYEKGSFDIRWTSPLDVNSNSSFNIIGVNIYRSFDSEFGPYMKLNSIPVGTTFWRDKTNIVLSCQENVSSRFISRNETDPDRRFIFKTFNRPILFQKYGDVRDDANFNAIVTVNGINAFVENIFSESGEIELRTHPTFDVTSQVMTPAVLPKNPDDIVLATYKYISNFVPTSLGQRIYYRVTSVSATPSGDLLETPLYRASQANNLEVEKLDYIWKEAIRRNNWILDHGGERVKLFIKKNAGIKCGCYSSTHKQPDSSCLSCYGVGFVHGYEGPYDITIAPDDGEKKSMNSNRGRTLSHDYDSWTGPRPLLSQRDFIVKLNGERYSIGPVRMPSNRGMQLAQFFRISHIDEQDIRYKVPVMDTSRIHVPRTNYAIPGEGNSTPMVTEARTVPNWREFRGRTVTYENINRRLWIMDITSSLQKLLDKALASCVDDIARDGVEALKKILDDYGFSKFEYLKNYEVLAHVSSDSITFEIVVDLEAVEEVPEESEEVPEDEIPENTKSTFQVSGFSVQRIRRNPVIRKTGLGAFDARRGPRKTRDARKTSTDRAIEHKIMAHAPRGLSLSPSGKISVTIKKTAKVDGDGIKIPTDSFQGIMKKIMEAVQSVILERFSLELQRIMAERWDFSELLI
jgi:hypothetical protein